MTLPQAPPSEAAVIGAEELSRLAEGLPVLVNGGRVLLVAASDFPRSLGGCASRGEVEMSDRSDREFAPLGHIPPPRPAPEFAALAARVSAIERLYDALEERVTDLEAAQPMLPPEAA